MSTPDESLAPGLVVVTGAGGDLAGTVVPYLAQRGWRVALTARPGNEGPTAARFAALQASGADVRTFPVDLASPAAVEAAFAKVRAELGKATALVHLAGRFEGGPAANAGPSATAAALERTLDGNLRSAVNAISAVLPDMLAARSGAIVAVGAAAAISPAPGSVAYAAAKGALVAYLRSLAAQVGKEGVSVGCIMPAGAFDTPGNHAAMPNGDASGWIAASAFAEAVAFILSRRPRGFVHELPLSAR